MKALSVLPPWAWAIVFAGKTENRDWVTAPGLVAQARALLGREIVIHAGLRCTPKVYDEASWFMVSKRLAGCGEMAGGKVSGRPTMPARADLVKGAIVGRGKLAQLVYTTGSGHRIPEEHRRPMRPKPCLLCRAKVTADPRCFPCDSADPWAIPGTIGLIFEDVVPLSEPVPWKGQLGFFEVPDDAVKLIEKVEGR